MIIIHGHPFSTCTRKVLMTLEETNTPYELAMVDFAKVEHKQPSHLQRQPFGRIPTLEDGGFEMFESRAIFRYVNRKCGGRLEPASLQSFARMEQWISIETSEFSPHAMKFIYHHTFKRAQEPAVLETARNALATTCSVMEEQLGRTPFIAGDTFSLADITFMPYLEYAMASPAQEMFAGHRHLAAWWNRISERPTWRKVTGRA